MMRRTIVAGTFMNVVAAALLCAQAPTPPAGGGGRGRQGGAGAAGGGGGRGAGEGTAAGWASPNPEAAKWIAQAKQLAGNDPDLMFDEGLFCQAGRGASNENRASVGVP